MTLPLDQLDLLTMPVTAVAGEPMKLPLDSIDEDPQQPRTEFDPQALEELAQTIKQRGVRQPISVRVHPSVHARWMLNFGARRLRASRLAGVADIPAFVDNTADGYDQVIENEQREGLNSLELALFVQRQLATGQQPTDIAMRLGKSRSYVTFISALIEAPDWLMNLYRSGRCRGIAEIYELRKLHGRHPVAVDSWLATDVVVTRAGVLSLKEELNRVCQDLPNGTVMNVISSQVEGAGQGTNRATVPDRSAAVARLRAAPVVATNSASGSFKRAVLFGITNGLEVRVMLDMPCKPEGHVLVAMPGSDELSAVSIESVSALRLAFQ
jgi:ParB family transcriptional regulator, chromosome partitioning protein